MNKQSLFIISGILAVVGVIVGLLVWHNGRTGHAETADEARFTYKDAVMAPDFTLSDVDGNSVTLSSLRGKNVVLFFSEGLMCYPCLEQMAELSKDPRLNNADTAALSLVTDSPRDWAKARQELSFLSGARVVFDAGNKVFQYYAALGLSPAMQRGPHPGHTYFIVDKEGAIRFVLDDPYMGIRNNLLVSEINEIN